jgi:hypothetical protein
MDLQLHMIQEQAKMHQLCLTLLETSKTNMQTLTQGSDVLKELKKDTPKKKPNKLKHTATAVMIILSLLLLTKDLKAMTEVIKALTELLKVVM